jgi:hypothetical protein
MSKPPALRVFTNKPYPIEFTLITFYLLLLIGMIHTAQPIVILFHIHLSCCLPLSLFEIAGSSDGKTLGSSDGSADGSSDGNTLGSSDGSTECSSDGQNII